MLSQFEEWTQAVISVTSWPVVMKACLDTLNVDEAVRWLQTIDSLMFSMKNGELRLRRWNDTE